MSDLVEWLRGPIGPLMYQHEDGIAVTNEAADEIERLRGKLRVISEAENAHWRIQAIAREALGDE